MAGTALGIVLDIALMLLLGVAIYFGVRLNRQMAIIRSGREEFEKLINEFGSATQRAESALADLRSEVARSVETAKTSSLKAAELCDDLEFLIKRGEKTADSLERGIRGGGERAAQAETRSTTTGDGRGLVVGDEDRAVPAAEPKAVKRESSAKKAKAKSKSELLKALQDMR